MKVRNAMSREVKINVVGLVIGVIGVLVGLAAAYFDWLPLRGKSLEWQAEAQGDLISVTDEVIASPELTISVNGQPVGDVEFMVLRLINTGGIAIEESDFREPLSLDFGEGTQIYTATIANKSPANLAIEVSNTASAVTFSEALINPGESFSVQILGSGLQNMPVANGRIVGISSIPVITSESSLNRVDVIGNILLGLVMVMGLQIVIKGRYGVHWVALVIFYLAAGAITGYSESVLTVNAIVVTVYGVILLSREVLRRRRPIVLEP